MKENKGFLNLRSVMKDGKEMIQIWIGDEFQEEFEHKPVTFVKNGKDWDFVPYKEKKK